jgi:hypothetical protein
MRKLILTLSILSSLCLFSACDFLNVYPDKDIFVTPEIAYNTKEDVERAMMGCYTSFAQTYNDNLLLIANSLCDDTYNSRASTFSDIAFAQLFNIYTADITQLWDLWQKSYAAIRNVNLLIANVDNSQMDSIQKNQYKAEALFLRAYLYFDLVKMWGDVPLVLTPLSDFEAAYKILRTPQSEVYDAIYRDIDLAIPNLADTHWPARANRDAAKFLKARTLLYQAKKSFVNDLKVLSLLNEISGFELVSDFSKLFNNAEGENSKESIFELQFYPQQGIGSTIPYNCSILGYMKGTTTSGAMAAGVITPSFQLLAKMPLYSDSRQSSTWEYFGTSIGQPVTTTTVCMKFNGLKNTSFVTSTGNNFMLMRYADVLLLKAEINARLGRITDALDALNPVRIRAGLSTLNEPLSAGELAALDGFIEDERFREFAFEGIRWWDLIRRGKMEETMSKFNQTPTVINFFSNYGIPNPAVDSMFRVFAIPNRVLQNNPNIKQNPGYN